MATPQHKTNPWIPRPKRKEEPGKLEDSGLVHPLEHPAIANVPLAYKQDVPIQVPNYNELYDNQGTKQAWRFTADQYVEGTVTTIAGTAVLSAVTLASSPQWSLGNWPDGTQVFLVIHTFNVGPQTASFVTQGEINVKFIDQFGNTAALGIIPNNNFSNLKPFQLIPSPITDPGNLILGNISFTLNTGATVGTYAWQIGMSAAYMLPAIKGYRIERISDEAYNDSRRNKRNSLD